MLVFGGGVLGCFEDEELVVVDVWVVVVDVDFELVFVEYGECDFVVCVLWMKFG